MNKCKKCGNEFDGDVCNVCGTKVEGEETCPYCGATLTPNANFCLHCWKPVSHYAEKPKSLVIKNETKRDLDFDARMNYHIAGKKNRLMYFVCALMFILLGAIVFAFEYLTSNGEEYEVSLVVFLVLFGVVFFIFALASKSMIRKAIQTNMQGMEATITYNFTESGYEVLTRISDGTMGKTWGGYGGFTEVKEFADMCLLYINKTTVLPVAKSGMKEGTAEELSALLSRAVGIRYKVCFKK